MKQNINIYDVKMPAIKDAAFYVDDWGLLVKDAKPEDINAETLYQLLTLAGYDGKKDVSVIKAPNIFNKSRYIIGYVSKEVPPEGEFVIDELYAVIPESLKIYFSNEGTEEN